MYKKEDISYNIEDEFKIESIYRNDDVTLKIDLEEVSPLFIGSIISGNLSFFTNFLEGPLYQ